MAAAAVTGTILASPYFKINNVDLSAYVTNINFINDVEIFMSKASGKAGQSRFSGIKDHNLKITMHQDFTSGAYPDSTLRGIIGTPVAIVVGQSSGTAGATNPTYSFYGAFYSYDPFGSGSVTQPQDITLEIFLADGFPATASVGS